MPMFVPLIIAVAGNLGTLAIIGGALSAIGGLVGNKTLSTIGSMFGLANAFSSLATGASGVAGEVAGGAGAEMAALEAAAFSPAPLDVISGADAASSAIEAAGGSIPGGGLLSNNATENVGQEVMSNAADSPAGYELMQGSKSPVDALDDTGANVLGDQRQIMLSGQNANAADGSVIDPQGALAVNAGTTAPLADPAAPANDLATQRLYSPNAWTVRPAFGEQGGAATTVPKPQGLIDRVMEMAKANPYLAYGAVNSVAGGIANAFKKDPNESIVAFRDRELAQKQANANAIPGRLPFSPNINSNLYPNGVRRLALQPGLIRRQWS